MRKGYGKQGMRVESGREREEESERYCKDSPLTCAQQLWRKSFFAQRGRCPAQASHAHPYHRPPPSHAPSFRGCLGLKKNFLALSTDGRPSRRRTLYPSFAWFLSLSLFLSLPFEHAFLFGKEAKGRQRRRRRRLRKSVFYGSVWW